MHSLYIWSPRTLHSLYHGLPRPCIHYIWSPWTLVIHY
ncbi:unnamed protein product, partial [Staurois parvus]